MMDKVLSEHKIPLGAYRIPSNIAPDLCGCFEAMQLFWVPERKLGYGAPLPDAEQLAAFYRGKYRPTMAKKTNFEVYVKSVFFRAQALTQVEWVAAAVGKSGAWLDVGAAYGLLLWEVQRQLPGWDRWAVEPDPQAQQHLARIARVAAEFDAFWDSSTPHARYDVISLSHVFEHLRDPWDAASRIRAHLRPGGVTMIEVPNDHMDEMKRRTRGGDLPHLWFFSLDGLAGVFRDAGFEILRGEVIGLDRRPAPLVTRLKQRVRPRFFGPLSKVRDRVWYGPGGDRTAIRILAKNPAT